MAIDYLSLKALRDQVNAGTRNVTFITDDGAPTQMVYIPKFTIPAGSMDANGFPSADITLGGFFVDKYTASHKAATSSNMGCSTSLSVTTGDTTNIPVSMPGRVPWTYIDQDSARNACANKKINGVSCHLITMEEWSTLCYLSILLGHELHGNNSWGRDYRDADIPANYGVRDSSLESYLLSNKKKVARTLTGTGPLSWSHNGAENGVMDLLGNVYEWNDFSITDSVFTSKEKATVNGAVTADSSYVALDYVENTGNWTDVGKIQIEDEIISYRAVTRGTDAAGWNTIILTSCSRGIDGTTAKDHADNVPAFLLKKQCAIPGGATAYLSADMAVDSTTLAYKDIVNGPGNTGISTGDLLQCGTELMTVTAAAGTTLTVTRSTQGSPASAHTLGTALCKINSMNINAPTTSPYEYCYYKDIRSDIPILGLPSNPGTAVKPWYDMFQITPYGKRGALRGGNWGGGSTARSGLVLVLTDAPATRGINIGFRSALSL